MGGFEDDFAASENQTKAGPLIVYDDHIYAVSGELGEGYSNPHVWSFLEPLDEPEPVCGNGIIEPLEECDDGNLIDGDGCDSTCTTELEPEPEPVPVIENDLSVDMKCEITCEDIVCEVEAENEGEGDVEDVEVTIKLPEEVEFVKAEASSAWDCDYSDNSRKVHCNREKVLISGENSEIKVKVNLLDPSEEIKISSAIDYDGSDSSDSNNEDSDKLKVDSCELKELPVTGKDNRIREGLFKKVFKVTGVINFCRNI